jgi:hypothetical protein
MKKIDQALIHTRGEYGQESRLPLLKDALKLSFFISHALEAFHKGEWLIEVKKITQGGYQKWIEDNLPGATYQSCYNYIKFFYACLGDVANAEKIKNLTTGYILGELPDTILTELIETGALENTTTPEAKKLRTILKTGGEDAVIQYIEEKLAKKIRIQEQTIYKLDRFEKVIQSVELLRDQLSKGKGKGTDGFHGQEAVANELTMELIDTLNDVIVQMVEKKKYCLSVITKITDEEVNQAMPGLQTYEPTWGEAVTLPPEKAA